VEAGGRFDGIAGVLAGLEVARCLDAGGRRLEHPLEVINFTCEEPSDFGLSTIGSRAMSGKLDATTAARLRDRSGRSLADAIDSVGGRGAVLDAARRTPEDVRRYLELHIEQAVSLDRAKIPLGVVTAIAAPSRYRVSIRGRQDHAGGTPMADRRDAVAAAAELVLLVERLARDAGRGMVGTVGVIEARPNMINIVPGEADLLVDFRGIVPDAITETLAHFEQEAAELGARRSVAVEWTSLMRESPLTVPPEMVAAVETAARAVGVPWQRPTSGASRRSHMARLRPIGLLFIPCWTGGPLPQEAEADHLATGTRVPSSPARIDRELR
jgi:hydantoinase/carbamoylase family amidase